MFDIAQYAARNEFGDVTGLTYLWMVQVGDTGKTKVWAVISKEGGFELGKVKWFGRWRCYAFFPTDSIFEPKCLREIADFIESRTQEHRATPRKSR